jgi:hypothetical protein
MLLQVRGRKFLLSLLRASQLPSLPSSRFASAA